jgi:hypothetical protein
MSNFGSSSPYMAHRVNLLSDEDDEEQSIVTIDLKKEYYSETEEHDALIDDNEELASNAGLCDY